MLRNEWDNKSMKFIPKNPEFIQQAIYGIIPNKPNNIRSYYLNSQGWSVAMILSCNKIYVPKEWQHDSLIANNDGQTVGIILSSQGIVPDEYWIHDIDMKDKQGNSIRSNLLKYKYIYLNGEFKFNVQTEIKWGICCRCMKKEEQIFIITICKHDVCLDCFKELIRCNQQKRCPCCRKENWFLELQRTEVQ